MGKSTKPAVSACMIVKNEEEFLPKCLTSIKDVVDEIIIVDTGSNDRTVTIAKGFGAKVYFYHWNENFSEARNYSISHASGEWILQIDADEELERACIPEFLCAISNEKYNGIIVSIVSIINDSLHKFYYPRIFRRGKAFYKDIIHEQIIIKGEQLPTEIKLYHHGYNLEEKKMQIKWQRTTQLLKKQITQDKYNSFAWFNLIHNYRSQNLFTDGIVAGEEAINIIKSAPAETKVHLHNFIMIIYETANCYLRVGDFIRAKKLCFYALSKIAELNITPENIDILFTLACIYLKEGGYQESINYFKRFLSLRERYFKNINRDYLIIDTLGYDYAAYNGLGYCFGNLGQWQMAINYLQKAISSNPRYLPTYKNLASSYSSCGNHIEAINTLSKAVSEGISDDNTMLKLGELYVKQEMYEKAVPHLEAYLKKYPYDKGVLLKIAQCYGKLGYLEAALVGYRLVLEKNNCKPE